MGNEENGNEGNRNEGNENVNGNGGGNGYNFEGFMPARECTYQDFLKCQPHNFNGKEGVVGLTRSFGKMETVFHISNCPEKYQVRTYEADDRIVFSKKQGPCTVRCGNCKRVGHMTMDCKVSVTPNTQRAPVGNQSGIVCYECGRLGHFRKDYPKFRNQNRRNQTGNKNGNKTGNQTGGNEATASSYANGGGGANPDSNVVTDTSYAIELTDERILETNVVLRGCMLGLLGHSFDVDLMPVKLGSFDVIIDIDWLAKYHSLIVCDENVFRIPYGDEVLIIRGDDCDGGTQVTSKKTKDKSEDKRLEDVSIVREFPEVFPEDFPGLPPARQVEFKIDLVLGAAPVARAHYRLAPAEMQELSTQL
nr:hypothetical protein [Tanacetum cinerariifolium]